MKEADACLLASTFAKQQGYDVNLYDVSAKKGNDEWAIHFHRISDKTYKPSPGDFFTVIVDMQLQVVRRLVPGK